MGPFADFTNPDILKRRHDRTRSLELKGMRTKCHRTAGRDCSAQSPGTGHTPPPSGISWNSAHSLKVTVPKRLKATI